MPMHVSVPTLSRSCCLQAVSGREGVVQLISVVEARVVALLTGKMLAGGRGTLCTVATVWLGYVLRG